ncbi:LysM peptidoglycan-binding domain-containing protein [Wielerella bovis]|uniref:LysM peptidoglycan-binding domain-containing protein n=1 Tax=Wielerella bovis TaxID=2917790 RepID=UPI002019F26E|nr:LysM peptidoglycan-binding domain-containing protein [Wielerella bovis]ULJ63212.1 LysM peptidoglycan-binding domain-containing protein [Wielerella bovis]
MKPIQTRWLLSATAAIILSACTTAGTSAPVVSGIDGYGYNNGTVTTPYGTATVPTTANTAGYGYNNGTVTTPYGTATVPTTANTAGYGYNNGTVTTPYGTATVPTTANTAGYGYNNGTVTTPYGTVATPYGTAPATGTVYTPPAAVADPYGTAATYTPDTTAYTQPAYTQPTYTAPASPAYSTVGNYPPVDVNATHHRVVSGDTVFNISKRYGISQEQLRSWNNLSDNTIKIGQTLRVKPQGYTGKNNTSSSTTLAAGTHRVVAGDSLYSLAKKYNVSQDQLRAWNNLQTDNIQKGQILRVQGNPTVVSRPQVPAYQPPPTPVVTQQPNIPTYPTQPTAPNYATPVANPTAPVITQPPVSTTIPVVAATMATTAPVAVNSIPTPTVTQARSSTKNGITWQTPLVGGKIAQSFSEALRGIELSGTRGTPILAAADGQVIYKGLGPRGYGNLIVLQHTQQYLTAYSNVENFVVKEGDDVKRGQQLGLLGTQKLHFEIREDGKAVNPTGFIPF